MQTHTTKHIKGSDLAAAVDGAQHVTSTFSKDEIPCCGPEVCKQQGFSIEFRTWKMKQVVSVHRRAGPDWSRKVREKWEIQNRVNNGKQ